MDINGHIIKTPMDHPWDFDPDWRNEMAKLMVDDGLIANPCGYDEYVDWQVQFLKALKDDSQVLGFYDNLPFNKHTKCSARRATMMAHQLYTSSGDHCMRDKVDAMLLCPELSIDDINEVLSSQSPYSEAFDLQVYERLYFNIRDDRGKVNEGCWLRELFATRGQDHVHENDRSTYWRVLAFQGGHRLLFSRWCWPAVTLEESENERRLALVRNSFCELEQRTRFGDIINRDLVALYGHLQDETMELRKRGMLGGDSVMEGGEMGLLLELLQAAAPQPIPPDPSKLAEKEEAVAQKLDLVKKTVKGNKTSDSLQNLSVQMEAATARESS